ncbi:MAG: hypothetical protein LBP69_01440 [Treponema sp.]|nr:hypothetical protein [Treponema sp.]
MKPVLFLVVFMASALSNLAAAEDQWQMFPYSLGGGVEMNMNAKEGWAQAFAATIDRHINPYLVLGVRGAMTNNYQGITATEGWVLARVYVFKWGTSGAFTQLGGGVSMFQEEERRGTAFSLNYGVGYRQYFFK